MTRNPRTWSKMQGNDIFIRLFRLKLALLLGKSVWIYIYVWGDQFIRRKMVLGAMRSKYVMECLHTFL